MSGIIIGLRSALTSSFSTFIAVNVGANLLFLARSYVAMRVLDHEQLGVMALMQTLMLLIATLQFGVINGGYRLLCSEGEQSSSRINDLVFTFIGALTAVSVVIVACALPFTTSARIALVVALGVLGGTSTLLRNWLANHLIAKVKLPRFNTATIWSAVLSLMALGLVPAAPLAACLVSVAIQPVAFVVLVLILEPALRPRTLQWPQPLVREVMAAGFTIFLTALLLQANQQIERWYIINFLGLASLGHLYLSILYTNLFQIVPTTFDSLFLSRVVTAHMNNRPAKVRREMRRFFLAVIAYCIIAAAATWLFAEPLLKAFLPRYIEDLGYVWLFFPGLLLFTLAGPFATTFNVLIRYKTYFYAYGLSTVVTAAVFALSALTGRLLDLAEVTLLKSIVYTLMAGSLLMGYVLISRSNMEFRFNPFRNSGESA
jgi:O-antigen/teichoic acid export membrane protein